MYNTQTLSSADWLNTTMAKVYGAMGLGLVITAIVALLTYSAPGFQAAILGTWLKWPVLLAPLGFVLVMSFGYKRFSATTLYGLFIAYAAINGLAFSAIMNVFRVGDILLALFSTIGLFGFMSVYGYFTKKDLTSLGQLLFVGLIGILIAMVVNLFVGSSVLATVISCVAVLVFLGLTAYDTQKIREQLWNGEDTGKTIVMGALTLYLDFVNLFIHLLQLLGVLGKSSD